MDTYEFIREIAALLFGAFCVWCVYRIFTSDATKEKYTVTVTSEPPSDATNETEDEEEEDDDEDETVAALRSLSVPTVLDAPLGFSQECTLCDVLYAYKAEHIEQHVSGAVSRCPLCHTMFGHGQSITIWDDEDVIDYKARCAEYEKDICNLKRALSNAERVGVLEGLFGLSDCRFWKPTKEELAELRKEHPHADLGDADDEA